MRFGFKIIFLTIIIIEAVTDVLASTYKIDLGNYCCMYFVCQDDYYVGEEFRGVCLFENSGSNDFWFTINFSFGWESRTHSYSGNQIEPGEKPDWRPILLEGNTAGIATCEAPGSYPIYVSFTSQSLGKYSQLVEETGDWIYLCRVKYKAGGKPSNYYEGAGDPSSGSGYYPSSSSYYGGLSRAFPMLADMAKSYLTSQLTPENVMATVVIPFYGGKYAPILSFLWSVYQILK